MVSRNPKIRDPFLEKSEIMTNLTPAFFTSRKAEPENRRTETPAENRKFRKAATREQERFFRLPRCPGANPAVLRPGKKVIERTNESLMDLE